jgi:magnesium-transporting ATPase (P-type)
MMIHQLLSPEHIIPRFDSGAADPVKALLDLVCSHCRLAEPEEQFEAEEMELLHGYRGEGLAVLHNLTEAVDRPQLFLALSPQGVLLNGERTQVIAVLLSPLKDSGDHFQILSRLIALLRHRRLRQDLLGRESAAGVWRSLKIREESGREEYWVLSREAMFEELETGEKGLNPEEARRRLEEIGPNRIVRLRRRPLILRFGANFVNLFSVLLWTASALAYLAGLPELTVAIALVIVVNAVFSFWQEYLAEKAVEALARLIPLESRVLRGGQVSLVDAAEIVPGDIILLEAGDHIPADARLIEAADFRVDNSALTGESRLAYKMDEPVDDGQEFLWTEMPNLVFAGTAAVAGEATGVVLATGMDTQLGNIASLTHQLKKKPSPLQREIQVVVKVVAAVALTVGCTFFLVGFLTGKLTLLPSLIFAIGMIVAFVPNGLPPIITLSLAMGVQRMARKKALVKRLSSVETLGAATVICTDKTGTLTTNELMVQRLWLGGDLLSVTGSGFDREGRLELDGQELPSRRLHSPLLDLFTSCAALCNNASPDGGVGDPTEAALLVLTAKAGRNVEDIRTTAPRLKAFPFESVRKRMSTVNGSPEGHPRVWVKGAPDSLVPLCDQYLDWQGKAHRLTTRDRGRLIQVMNDLAQRGLRLLALAFKETESRELTLTQAESGLSLLGIAGMIDPPRPEVPEAIARCHRAGIRILMVTGDYGGTARAVAEDIGMSLDPETPLFTGEQVSRMTEVQLRKLLKGKGAMIFARSSPEQKLRIVEALLHLGEVVAVTGDGVNDAPALKAADIGVSMGKKGTEVSKGAASMILADDNFASIVAAIQEGRAVYANIKKFITYMFVSNVAEAAPFVFFVLMGIPLPLVIMQVLAVDVGTDLLPALGLGAEPPEPGIMSRPPRSRLAHLIDWGVARRFVFLGLLEAGAGMLAYYYAYWTAGWRPGLEMAASGPLYVRATTMCLAGIVAAQVGCVLAIRTQWESIFKVGLFTNRFVIWGIAFEIALLLAFIYVPFLQKFFHTAPLTGSDLLFLLIFPPILILADEIRKAWRRWRRAGAPATSGR